MTVTLEPETENEVRRKAAAQGQPPETYLQQLVREALSRPLPMPIPPSLTPEESRRLRQESWDRAVARNLPASSSDFRREDIYDDEEGC